MSRHPSGAPQILLNGNAKRRADCSASTVCDHVHARDGRTPSRSRWRWPTDEAGPHARAGVELDRAAQARGHPGRDADGAGGPRRRAGGGRLVRRDVRAARRRRVRQGQQRGRRPRRGAAPRAVGDGRRASSWSRRPTTCGSRPPRTLGRLAQPGRARAALHRRPASPPSWPGPTSRSTRSSAPASAACPRTSGPRRSSELNASCGAGRRRRHPLRRGRRDGRGDGDAVEAELTVTFGAAKAGRSCSCPAPNARASCAVVDIGFPDELVRTDLSLAEPEDVAAVLPPRDGRHAQASLGRADGRGRLARHDGRAPLDRRGRRADRGRTGRRSPCRRRSCPIVQAAASRPCSRPSPKTSAGTVAAGASSTVLESLERRGLARDRSGPHAR